MKLKVRHKELCSIRVKAAIYGQIWSLTTALLVLTWSSSGCFLCMSGGLFPCPYVGGESASIGLSCENIYLLIRK